MAILEKTFQLKIRLESDVSEADLHTRFEILIDDIRHDMKVQKRNLSTIWTSWDESSKAVASIDMVDDTLTGQLAAATQERDELLQYCREAQAASIIDKILTERKDKQIS